MRSLAEFNAAFHAELRRFHDAGGGLDEQSRVGRGKTGLIGILPLWIVGGRGRLRTRCRPVVPKT